MAKITLKALEKKAATIRQTLTGADANDLGRAVSWGDSLNALREQYELFRADHQDAASWAGWCKEAIPERSYRACREYCQLAEAHAAGRLAGCKSIAAARKILRGEKGEGDGEATVRAAVPRLTDVDLQALTAALAESGVHAAPRVVLEAVARAGFRITRSVATSPTTPTTSPATRTRASEGLEAHPEDVHHPVA